MIPAAERRIFGVGAALLCLFLLAEVNYPQLPPQSQLSLFALLGLVLVFLKFPSSRAPRTRRWRVVDALLCVLTILCFGYVFTQVEPTLSMLWLDEVALGHRAGAENPLDFWVGLAGLVLILEAARRAVGPALPALALLFVLYAATGPLMPDWLFPHRGYSWQRIVSQTFLHSQGVFGVPLRVMFTYVFLFVLFGALLERTGAIGFILGFARRWLGQSAGGPAKVAVVGSGLMGSLSGSAVANTATTGTFTIPLMRAVGFRREIAAGVEAAASSGGALVPPIMGAGAYMMLELVDPPVTYLQIVRAALLPAVLYYLSLLLVVHLQARRQGSAGESQTHKTSGVWPGIVFGGAFATLLIFLLLGYTPFRAVSLGLLTTVILAGCGSDTRVGPRGLLQAAERAAHSGVALVAAAACVGTIIGVVTLTGIGSKLPGLLLPLAQDNLPAALVLLMVSTIILGLGLPSAVCYLLMATFVGPLLADLGPTPLAGHLFIFYFGMMSMVTPPVALAAYTAAAIAGSQILKTGLAAFRFASIGFALPYAFVLRPELLMLAPTGGAASVGAVLINLGTAAIGVGALASAVAGYLRTPLGATPRLLLVAVSAVFLFVGPNLNNLAMFLGAAMAGVAALLLNRRVQIAQSPPP